ncbi:MAG: Ger(x)C family spore germination protein [Firmicutes bacterium]|nr:Ger(x)C family spore germination protein [Bacillota bacterium]
MTIKARTLRRTVALLLLTGLALTGCWDNRPIDERAIVMVLGVSSRHGRLALRFQIPTASALTALPSGSSGNSQSESFFVLPAEGRTVASAFGRAQASVSRDLYLGQIQALVLSAKLPPRVLRAAMTGLARLEPVDRTIFVLTTPDPVTRLLSTPTPLNQLPNEYFSTLFNCPDCATLHLQVRLWQLMDRLVTPGVDPFLPVARLGPHGIELNQVALYAKDRYLATLSPQETVAFALLTGRAVKPTLSAPTPLGETALRVGTCRGGFSARIVHGRPQARFTVSIDGQLVDGPALDGDRTARARVLQAVARQVTARCLALIRHTQALGSDPFGVGRRLHWTDPRGFQALGPWDRAWKQTRVTVTVHVETTRAGNIRPLGPNF